jgi:hypothetical protein
MNKERRKIIKEAIDKITEAQDLLSTVLNEEQEAFDNLPEGIQMSERGETMEQYINSIDDIIYNIDEGVSTLEEML